ncbi:lysophospholipid transporter LplT [Polynucleobacter kasalickyi]|uniref:Major Facilitator Superfamily protein n=1 Tax=Polynucleobacter kasalickyi TaxID=1938817 RepID=A0A1W2BHX5_9BURK|nr:lysophospholipid transporter LplT [Polynucleobacter kasalickyi]SMC72481.1 Major Facilitator Superfamily protein [Polynucleobacter kasalickyi]
MKPGFYAIMSAQFFSSLADNALLIAAIALLLQLDSPAWMTPLLKLFFVLSYVVLAAFVGAFADSRPKGKVMLMTNAIKLIGCLVMLFGFHPLAAYAIVGFGAAAYSPAKYGILTELLPPEKLVAANGWIEGLTVGSIILGTVLGGILINPSVAATLLSIDLPVFDSHIDTPPEAAIAIIMVLYFIAALINLKIPDTGVVYENINKNPIKLVQNFAHCFKVLWSDRLGQISLAVTTLFWGIGATLQFIILKWAESALQMDLSRSAILQAVVALGVAGGAIWAAARVPLKNSLVVLKYGVIMGFFVITLAGFQQHQFGDYVIHFGFIHVPAHLLFIYIFLFIIGWMSGYFVVPMNALLQHRGHVLLSAGHSIAVQNLNENLSVLVMLGIYSLLISLNVPVQVVILCFGCFVIISMALVIHWHKSNQKEYDSLHLIGEEKHH